MLDFRPDSACQSRENAAAHDTKSKRNEGDQDRRECAIAWEEPGLKRRGAARRYLKSLFIGAVCTVDNLQHSISVIDDTILIFHM